MGGFWCVTKCASLELSASLAHIEGWCRWQQLVFGSEGIKPVVAIETSNKPVSITATVWWDLYSLAGSTVSRVDGGLGPCATHATSSTVLVNIHHILATFWVLLDCDSLRASSRTTLLQESREKFWISKQWYLEVLCQIPYCPCQGCLGHMTSCCIWCHSSGYLAC